MEVHKDELPKSNIVATNSFSRIDMVDWVQKNAPPEDMVACLAIFGKLIDPRTKDADMMLGVYFIREKGDDRMQGTLIIKGDIETSNQSRPSSDQRGEFARLLLILSRCRKIG